MPCCCGGFGGFGSCADCCPQWTLPGGATAVPTEIQAAVSIGEFEVCFTASRNLGFILPVCAKLGTISHSGTYTLTRQNIGSFGCGQWSYSNCSGNEFIEIFAGLVFAGGNCVWNASVAYTKWLPCAEDQFASGGIYRHPDMLSCNGTDYGYRAGARGSSFDNSGTLPSFTMTFPCQAGSFSNSVTHYSGAPLPWGSFCGRPGVSCNFSTSCGCGSMYPGYCPNSPSSTVTITLTV